ncbi:hypothetical protein BDV95DRAFT_636840 [Massariosphaeria phaeospora]|uniref:Protein kinase domain-containing protein n=1 Tax=Massariosphaeria phaeospora TaxID=100035 RepID=A0A7C8I9L0_9PLEO|nr:hypothetical protein BDV95DRAFT_636840 [Massariosphaeria phaeospora]
MWGTEVCCSWQELPELLEATSANTMPSRALHRDLSTMAPDWERLRQATKEDILKTYEIIHRIRPNLWLCFVKKDHPAARSAIQALGADTSQVFNDLRKTFVVAKTLVEHSAASAIPLQQEHTVLTKLSSSPFPKLVKAYTQTSEGHQWITALLMRNIDRGVTLEQVRKHFSTTSNEQLPIELIAHTFVQTAHQLDTLYNEHQVAHMDIHAGNLVFDFTNIQPQTKLPGISLIDFGASATATVLQDRLPDAQKLCSMIAGLLQAGNGPEGKERFDDFGLFEDAIIKGQKGESGLKLLGPDKKFRQQAQECANRCSKQIAENLENLVERLAQQELPDKVIEAAIESG